MFEENKQAKSLKESSGDSSMGEDLDDLSSNWSAKDSIDLEIKQMRRDDRKKNKKKPDKPPKLMVEKELKKGELDLAEK